MQRLRDTDNTLQPHNMDIDQQNEPTENTPVSIEKYGKEYSESKLMDKITKFAKQAGVKIIYAALLAYYVLQDKDFPTAHKVRIIGALGYFILPIDLIPDAIPVVGYTDDLAALVYALYTAWSHVTPEIEAKALAKAKSIFGEVKAEDIKLF